MFTTHVLFVCTVFLLGILQTGFKVSCCKEVEYITIDDPRRSTAYRSGSGKLCDRGIILEDVWYRFSSEAGDEIPTTLPKLGSCDTAVPIWINGVNPTVKDGIVTRKACADRPHGKPRGCSVSYNIRVRNCSGFYIYQLKKPLQCYFAYCAGSKLPNCTNADPKDYCLANRPPSINMPDRYYTWENSKFKLVFNATDPEGYPMRYNYLANKTVNTVSIDKKRKLITIFVKKSGSVTLEVTDYEHLKSFHGVEILTIPCSCQNGGKCFNHKNVSTVREDLSNFTCECVKPYSGKLCQISPCNTLPCYPGVNCSVVGESYKCEACPIKLKGDGKDCLLNLDDDDIVVEGELKIISGLQWTYDLLNRTSVLYKQQTAKILSQITQFYRNIKDFMNVVVTRYRYANGSAVVELQVVFEKKVDDPFEPVRASARQNNSGILKVDPRSVKVQENRPPRIDMPELFYALENSGFELKLNATDPEGYPLRYSLLSNKTVSSVAVDQSQNVVKVAVKESGRFSLRVKDYGGLDYVHTVKIIAISCNCQSGGKCYSRIKASPNREDLSNVECKCVKPYTGRFCEVSPCDNMPCYPGVKCSVEDANYKCKACPKKFGGDGKDCQLILNDADIVVEGELKITSGLKWTDDLLNKSSLFYKRQTVKIEDEIRKTYGSTENFLAVVIIRFREGSVVVEFQLVLKKEMGDPLKLLRTRASQESFGNFTVDEHSVKEKNSTEVEGTLKVLSGLTWKDDLLDKNTLYFKKESFRIANEINKIYEGEEHFVYVFVTGFRKKDEVVEFKLVWRTTVKNPLQKLREETKDGTLGNLKIDNDSVKEKTTTTSNSDDSSYFGLKKAVFIVLVCLVSLLALICIVVCGVCIRKKHISIIMLTTHDDHREICPSTSKEAPPLQMKKRPSHNQVVDLEMTRKT